MWLFIVCLYLEVFYMIQFVNGWIYCSGDVVFVWVVVFDVGSYDMEVVDVEIFVLLVVQQYVKDVCLIKLLMVGIWWWCVCFVVVDGKIGLWSDVLCFCVFDILLDVVLIVVVEVGNDGKLYVYWFVLLFELVVFGVCMCV